MAFFLFLLVNANLFVRPAEIVPAMLGWELYFYFIVACLVLSAPEILRHLTEKSLDQQPVTLCVIGLAILIPLSGLAAGNMADAWRASLLFAKIVAYYLLFVSLVTTPARLRTLLLCILMFCGTITVVAVLRYHDVIQLATIKPLKEHVDGQYGDHYFIQRLQGTGIFQDPNELCVLLAAVIPLGLYFLITDRSLLLRGVCVTILPVFVYALYLTHSRGGFLAALGGLGVLFWTRYGWKKSALIGLCGLPVLMLMGGRQTQISTDTGTARTRIELWQDWLQTFREHPLAGKSMTMEPEDETAKFIVEGDIRHLAHNSYLQAFADLGIFGGGLYLGAFLTALWSIYRLKAGSCVQLNRDVKQLQPFVLASVFAYCTGMLTLSICFVVPTYLILALAVAYTQVSRRSCLTAPAPLRFDLRLMAAFSVVGISFLFSILIFVRLFA